MLPSILQSDYHTHHPVSASRSLGLPHSKPSSKPPTSERLLPSLTKQALRRSNAQKKSKLSNSEPNSIRIHGRFSSCFQSDLCYADLFAIHYQTSIAHCTSPSTHSIHHSIHITLLTLFFQLQPLHTQPSTPYSTPSLRVSPCEVQSHQSGFVFFPLGGGMYIMNFLCR